MAKFDPMGLKRELERLLEGDVSLEEKDLETYSRDTSLFSVRPKLVVFPKHAEDVKKLVQFVNEHKASYEDLSLTGRSAGTDMSGGPLTESIVVVFTKYFDKEEIDEHALEAYVEPGVYYRDFEKETLPEHISMPVYPASKRIAAFGGMIMNNCGGENSLRHGQMRNFVKELGVVLADGNEYALRKLDARELEIKKQQQNFEGEVYRKTFDLIEKNYELIKRSKPDVSKNSAGYALWDIYDRDTGEFDLSQLFTGSQGTLGILTSAKIRLVKDPQYKRLVTLFFKSWDDVPKATNLVLPLDPLSLEMFDKDTMKLGIRFMPEIAKKVGVTLGAFLLQFLPEVKIGLRFLGMPKVVVLVELAEETRRGLDEKTVRVKEALEKSGVVHRVLYREQEAEKYWVMRRESFALLRSHVKGKKTAPFVDDFCVKPEVMPEFLPKALKILKKHGIKANLTGHAGNGNFHIIPLMDLTKASERAKIVPAAKEFYDLVNRYEGTITAEHNDGIMRTPFLKDMYGEEMYALFREVKKIFDPQNIFNPGKKVGGSLKYLEEHIAKD